MTLNRHQSDRGDSTPGVIIMMGIMVVVLLFTVLVGRVVTAQQDVISAARDGARAAVQEQNKGAAQTVAQTAVAKTLASAGIVCDELTVAASLGAFEPGDLVTVEVRCKVSLEDLSSWGVGAKVYEVSASDVVDYYRGG